MPKMRIVETDNFGGDYPDERFLDLPVLNEHVANQICQLINTDVNNGITHPRYWKVVPMDYVLIPGFQP